MVEDDTAKLDIAVCGPAGLLNHIRVLAVANGVEPEKIRHELFVFR